MNAIDERTQTLIRDTWRDSIVPTLCEYVRIPNKSPAFAPDWQSTGHMQRAAQLLADWCRAQPIAGMTVELLTLPGRTPVLLCDIPGELPDCVLLYGHLDKQPEFTGWEPGLSPWEPVIRDGKLYGRGGADDGYAVFSSLTAIRALKNRGIPLARCVVLIEASEESGSTDLPAHLAARDSVRLRSSSASMPNAATTHSSGAPPRCAAISPARCRSKCCAMAYTAAWAQALHPHPCASPCNCSGASKTRSMAIFYCRNCNARSPKIASPKRASPLRRSAPKSRVAYRCSPA
jgi:hypothetical protein